MASRIQYMIMGALAAAAVCSCKPNLDIMIPADGVGFAKNELLRDVSVMDGQYQIAVIKGGKGMNGGNVSIEIDESYLSWINDSLKTSYKALDSSLYAIDVTSFNMDASTTRQVINVTWTPGDVLPKVADNLSVIPLRVSSTNLVANESRSFVMIRPFKSTVSMSLDGGRVQPNPDAPAVSKGVFTVKIDLPLTTTDLTFNLAVDNGLIPEINAKDDLKAIAACDGLFALNSTRLTIKAGETSASVECSLDCNKVAKDGDMLYEDDMIVPVQIASASPNCVNVVNTPDTYCAVYNSAAGGGTVKRPTTPSSTYMGPWEVLEGAELNRASEVDWAGGLYSVAAMVDGVLGDILVTDAGNFFWCSKYESNEFPMTFVFDTGDTYIFDRFIEVDCSSYQAQYRWFEVYTARKYVGKDTIWELAAKGNANPHYNWVNPGSASMADFTHYVPEEPNGEGSFVNLTKGRYIKLVIVKPEWTDGDFLNGRGRIREFYFEGWKMD